jgi:hypothetical protein
MLLLCVSLVFEIHQTHMFEVNCSTNSNSKDLLVLSATQVTMAAEGLIF